MYGIYVASPSIKLSSKSSAIEWRIVHTERNPSKIKLSFLLGEFVRCAAFFRLSRNFPYRSYTVDSYPIFPVRHGNFFLPFCTKPGLKLFVVCSVRFRHCVCNKDILILHTRFFLHFGLLLTFFSVALHSLVVSRMRKSGGSKEWNKCLPKL